MKAYLELTKQTLPYHQERSFFEALKHTSREHGYIGFMPKTRFLLTRLKDHCLQVMSRSLPFNGIRVQMQKWRGVSIGKNVHLGPLVTIDDVYPYFVNIGEGSSIAGQNLILTHTKPLAYHSKVSESYVAPVIIEKNVWVAVGVIILPGVTIGEGSIIASGSVVTKSIPPLVFAAGIPAEIKKDLAKKLKKNYSTQAFEAILERRKRDYTYLSSELIE